MRKYLCNVQEYLIVSIALYLITFLFYSSHFSPLKRVEFKSRSRKDLARGFFWENFKRIQTSHLTRLDLRPRGTGFCWNFFFFFCFVWQRFAYNNRGERLGYMKRRWGKKIFNVASSQQTRFSRVFARHACVSEVLAVMNIFPKLLQTSSSPAQDLLFLGDDHVEVVLVGGQSLRPISWLLTTRSSLWVIYNHSQLIFHSRIETLIHKLPY